MMVRSISIALALLACTAQAKVIGVVDANGARIELHDEPGQCVGGAMRAEYIARDGSRVPGCWTQRRPDLVGVVFMDGDVATVPIEAIRPPVEI